MKLPAVGQVQSFALLAAIAIGGFVLYRIYRGGVILTKQVGEVISTDLNPASDKNIVYRSANSAFFDSGETLGGWFYDLVHKDKVDALLKSGTTRLPPTTPANGQTIRGVNSTKTSKTNTSTVDANPLTRTKAASYTWTGL